MADNPADPSDASPDLGQGAFGQDDLDALLEGAAMSPGGAKPQSAPATSELLSESTGSPLTDVDALLGGAGTTARGPVAAGKTANGVPADLHAVSRADVDLLLDAAGETGMPKAEPSSGDRAPEAPPTHPSIEAGQAGGRESAPQPDARPYEPQELGDAIDTAVDPKRVTMLNDVNLRVKIQLGRTRMLVEDVLKLGEGSVVELDKLAGDPVDVLVNDRLIARGEVLVLNDNFCVRISEVLSHDPHRITE